MATHDYVLANQSGAAFRTDLNNALAAIVSNNSNSSQPATRYAYQWWADTSAGVMKIRNSANDGWIELFQLDGTLTLENGTNSAPALAFRDDLDTGIYKSAANTFNVATGGVNRMALGTTTIFNDDGEDVNFRIEGDTDTNLFFLDAGNNQIGIGVASVPTGFKLAVNGDLSLGETGGSDNTFIDQKQNGMLEIINSGRDDNAAAIRINRMNSIGGDTTYFRDVNIYDGKGSSVMYVDGSAASVGIDKTSPAKKLDVNGEIRASSGILFGSDTAAANALDDYEEGTWTPTLTSGPTFTVQTAKYTKIGNVVFIVCSIFRTEGGTFTSDLIVGGLPFTVVNSLNVAGLGVASSFGGSSNRKTGTIDASNDQTIKIIKDGTTANVSYDNFVDQNRSFSAKWFYYTS